MSTVELLKGKLTPEKEITLDSILSDLKTEEKSEIIKNAQKNIKPAPMPKIQDDPRDNYPQFQKKGGKIKTKSKYSKGGGVRATKYKI
jgi:hypothetical protein